MAPWHTAAGSYRVECWECTEEFIGEGLKSSTAYALAKQHKSQHPTHEVVVFREQWTDIE